MVKNNKKKGNNPWGRAGKPAYRSGSLGLINNPWGRAGKPVFAVKAPSSSFLEQVSRGFEKFLESPFKKGK